MAFGGVGIIGCGLLTIGLNAHDGSIIPAEIGLALTGLAVGAASAVRAVTASALINVARMAGATMGIAILGAIFAIVHDAPCGLRLSMLLGGLTTIVTSQRDLRLCIEAHDARTGKNVNSSPDIFNKYRSRLIGIAYRMLGSHADAEDILQDAYVRWLQSDVSELRSPEAWLVTVVTRLSIDRLRIARKERESYIGPWIPEPWVMEHAPPAEQSIELAGDISTAFLMVLERLAHRRSRSIEGAVLGGRQPHRTRRRQGAFRPERSERTGTRVTALSRGQTILRWPHDVPHRTNQRYARHTPLCRRQSGIGNVGRHRRQVHPGHLCRAQSR